MVIVDELAGEEEVGAARFDAFARDLDRRLWQALVPVAGIERAGEAVNEALTYAWQHWNRVEGLHNPEGYLYRLAYRSATRARPGNSAAVGLPRSESDELPDVEPRLVPALASLSESQRTVVWLVDACGWGLTDTAAVLGVSVSTIRNHRARGLRHLRAALEVSVDD